jgi:hypothetical protein
MEDQSVGGRQQNPTGGRVEAGRGCWSLKTVPFPDPLIKPDVRLSRIRHRE